MNELSQEFLSYYESTFKPVALKCSEGFLSMRDAENGKISIEGKELEGVKSAVDANAIWYVGLLISDVENAKFSNGRLNLLNSISTVDGCLNSESYWANVWKNDTSSDEAKNLKELAGLTKGLALKL